MSSSYEEKKEARIERYKELAEKHQKTADELSKRSHDMASIIPFGQPILVGHYSEGRDRRYRDRIHRTMEKSFEEKDKANYYKSKALSAESNTSISSDDPEAITKLKEKIESLKEEQERNKSINKIIKSKKKNYTIEQKKEDLTKIGLKPHTIDLLFEPDCFNEIGIPSYRLTNNNANIRRLEERLKTLEVKSKDETKEYIIGDITISDNVEENRVMICFPGKPDLETIHKLKTMGFRWSPSNECWQAYRNNRTYYNIKQLFGIQIWKSG
jgi:DNA repair exonuclease SbcCD ATPase subunit